MKKLLIICCIFVVSSCIPTSVENTPLIITNIENIRNPNNYRRYRLELNYNPTLIVYTNIKYSLGDTLQ